MPFRTIPQDLQNLSSQVALEAYAALSLAERDLVNTDIQAWHRVYDEKCREVKARYGLN
jgi:hypothetical protein